VTTADRLPAEGDRKTEPRPSADLWRDDWLQPSGQAVGRVEPAGGVVGVELRQASRRGRSIA